MIVNTDRCEAFGIDPLRVASIAKRISRAVKDANYLGLILFASAGTGDLRRTGGSQNIVAVLDGDFDGGRWRR